MMSKLAGLEDLRVGQLYMVRIMNPLTLGTYMEYEDLKFIKFNEDGNPTFIDQCTYPSSPYHNVPMFFKASNFESGESYSLSIYEQKYKIKL